MTEPVATRTQFDRIRIEGASLAFLSPPIVVSVVEGCPSTSPHIAHASEGEPIEFEVDAYTDYQATIFVGHDPADRESYIRELPLNDQLILDRLLYTMLAAGRQANAMVDEGRATFFDISRATAEMNARLDSEEPTP